MWLVTTFGFFCVVVTDNDRSAGTLTVCARAAGDLQALRDIYLPTLGATGADTENDYRFSAKAGRAELAQAVSAMVEAIDYRNFGPAVAYHHGLDRSLAYGAAEDALDAFHEDAWR